MDLIGRKGLARNINGTDAMLVIPQLRQTRETYEPELWALFMREVRPGDYVADVGAHHGLYTIAIAKRVRDGGKVIAFEPQPENFEVLRAQVALNRISGSVTLEKLALSRAPGEVSFNDQSVQSSIATGPTGGDRKSVV